MLKKQLIIMAKCFIVQYGYNSSFSHIISLVIGLYCITCKVNDNNYYISCENNDLTRWIISCVEYLFDDYENALTVYTDVLAINNSKLSDIKIIKK